MSIWKRSMTLAELNRTSKDTLADHLGIVYTRLSEDELEGTLPVDGRTRQPFGLLHGGASAVLAESLGSLAGYLCTEGDAHIVGLEINASHIRAVREGRVRGVCRAVHVGRTHQVWDIRLYDDQDRLSCLARLTTAVLQPR
ncbi:hotdog fold thioesterase [Martelella alba]|uniref:Hotdog fold thioesterase n=1 Tax=Martelella alba TaxID=2590451 RepID=A0ABY2SJS7_9HYPH|nr:hotdog fold thioesterase [Martelella alba]TKI05630.1 hotdog fold thioesterase [Martelella alba]